MKNSTFLYLSFLFFFQIICCMEDPRQIDAPVSASAVSTNTTAAPLSSPAASLCTLPADALRETILQIPGRTSEIAIRRIKALALTNSPLVRLVNNEATMNLLIPTLALRYSEHPYTTATKFKMPGARNWLKKQVTTGIDHATYQAVQEIFAVKDMVVKEVKEEFKINHPRDPFRQTPTLFQWNSPLQTEQGLLLQELRGVLFIFTPWGQIPLLGTPADSSIDIFEAQKRVRERLGCSQTDEIKKDNCFAIDAINKKNIPRFTRAAPKHLSSEAKRLVWDYITGHRVGVQETQATPPLSLSIQQKTASQDAPKIHNPCGNCRKGNCGIKCPWCTTRYCSLECQTTAWEKHQEIHKNDTKSNIIQLCSEYFLNPRKEVETIMKNLMQLTIVTPEDIKRFIDDLDQVRKGWRQVPPSEYVPYLSFCGEDDKIYDYEHDYYLFARTNQKVDHAGKPFDALMVLSIIADDCLNTKVIMKELPAINEDRVIECLWIPKNSIHAFNLAFGFCYLTDSQQ